MLRGRAQVMELHVEAAGYEPRVQVIDARGKSGTRLKIAVFLRADR